MTAAIALIRLELLMALRERRLAVALAVCASVLTASGMVVLSATDRARQDRTAVAANERARWLGQGEKDPHSAAHYSIYAFKPVPSLAVLDPGIEPFVGETVWLEAHHQNDLLNRPMQESTAIDRAGLADPAALFVRFSPLVIFFLVFASVARDREQGTLGLALSAAPSGRVVAMVKAAAATLAAAAVTVGPLLVVALAGVILGGTAGHAVPRMVAWAMAAAAYVGVFVLLATIVCLLASSARAAFAALVVAWAILVLGAPPAASSLAGAVRPLPSFQAMKIRLDRDAPAYWTLEVGDQRRAKLFERYGVSGEPDLEARRVNLRGLELDYAERIGQDVFDREIGGFYKVAIDQDALYGWLGWLSPAIAMDAASSALTGTDFTHHLAFVEAAETYRRNLVNRMNADLLPNPTIGSAVHTNDGRLWSEIPEFSFTAPTLDFASRAAAQPVAALAGWLAAAGILVAALSSRIRP